ncbi:TIGR02117 family protein, partial [Mesorhizobium sp.]
HILVLKNPIHTDIAIPVDDDVRERFHFLTDAGIPADMAKVSYIVFGWGGRAFYLETPTWSELKAVPVMKALTSDASVMHVDVTGDIVEPHANVAGFDIDEERFVVLLDFIAASFQQGPNGPILIENAAYSRFDRFYEANGRFNALVGCNTWTAAALRTAGLRTGWWNPLPVSLDLSMRLYN